MIRGESRRIAQVRYVLPRHKAATWVGPGCGRASTRPGANGIVALTAFEFLDRLDERREAVRQGRTTSFAREEARQRLVDRYA